jgi:aspartate/methionine/tyrosine aminotransferase
MPLTPQQAATLELHRQLDLILTPGFVGRFVSGYQTTHPFINSYLDELALKSNIAASMGIYSFAQDELQLIEGIRDFHKVADGVDYAPEEILLSAGSSPLLLVLMMFVRQSAIPFLCYFRPIYHAVYFFADLLDVALLPLSDQPPWDAESGLALPEGRHVLLFADPVWIAGRSVGEGVLDSIRRWQDRTGSTVIVDGTFQYLKWESVAREEGATRLSREHTIRLVCPTKCLALHGIRFAYLLGPAPLLQQLRWACDNVTGSASTFDLHAATRMMKIMSSPEGNWPLRDYIRTRYYQLLANGFIVRTACEPDCGYYVFGQTSCSSTTDLVMDGKYFELNHLDGCVRINLLSPHVTT